jgi:hypothetical protein
LVKPHPNAPLAAAAVLGAACAGGAAETAAGALLLAAWFGGLFVLSRVMMAGRGNVPLGLVLAFATGVLYGGLKHVVDGHSLRAFLAVFGDRVEWAPLGLTGVVAMVGMWVLWAWKESI